MPADFFFDGTENDGVADSKKTPAVDTNVYKMYLADPSVNRHYFYGVGTRTHTWVGGATGLGADAIIASAETALTKDLNIGANVIDIVGFSRGSARRLSSPTGSPIT